MRRCISPVTSIASTLSFDGGIFFGSLTNKSQIRYSKARFQPTSDHLAVAWMYAQWLSIINTRPHYAMQFCKKNNLHIDRMSILHSK